MKNLTLVCMLFALVAIQYTTAHTLFVDMDMLDTLKKNYLIQANLTAEKNLQIEVQFLNGFSYIQVEYTPFMNGEVWKAAEDGTLMDLPQTKGLSKVYNFKFSQIMKDFSRIDSPCVRIEHSNDALCQFRLKLNNEPAGTSAWKLVTPFYLRIFNSTVGSPATIKLYGGSHMASDTADISAKNADTTNDRRKVVQLTFSHNATDYSDPTRILKISPTNAGGSTLIQEVKTKFYYFDCIRFKKLVEVYESQTLAAKNGVAINLAALGLPFDDSYGCSTTVITTDIHKGHNLIPIKAQELVKIMTNADSKYWPIPEPQDLEEKNRNLEQELKRGAAELNRTQEALKQTREILLRMEVSLNQTRQQFASVSEAVASQSELLRIQNELKKAHEAQHREQGKLRETHGKLEKMIDMMKEIQGSLANGRSLAGKSVRFLMSKMIRRA